PPRRDERGPFRAARVPAWLFVIRYGTDPFHIRAMLGAAEARLKAHEAAPAERVGGMTWRTTRGISRHWKRRDGHWAEAATTACLPLRPRSSGRRISSPA